MLIAMFPKLENTKFTQYVRAFFRSPYYPFVIAALMALSEIFALELPVYYIYLCIGILCAFVCEDTLGILPIVCCSYMTFAYKNNPHGANEQKLFSNAANMTQLIFILAVAVVILLARLVTYLIDHPKRKLPFLTVGFIVLLAGYLLSGVGYPEYVAGDAIFFAFAQIAALSLFYFYFYFTVDWERVEKSYIFTVFIAIGVGLLAEIGGMYTHEGVFKRLDDGSWEVNRSALGTGWGVYNNVGCVMAMCIPAPFYFAVKNEKWGWAFSILGCVFMLGVALTQSRGSILFGAVVFAACVVTVLVMAKGKNRILNIVVFGSMLLALVIAMILFHDEVGRLFIAIEKTARDFFNQLLANELKPDQLSSGRISQYKECWNKFTEYPFLGVGFHNLGDGGGGFSHLKGSVLIPPRAHNTFFQLIASGGVVVTLAYLVHRVQTLWLWLKKPNFEKTMAAFIIGALLLTSLLDCHFFNYGPGLLYSCVLVYMECCANRQAPPAPTAHSASAAHPERSEESH